MDEKSNGIKNGRKTKAQLQEELNKTWVERDEARDLLKVKESRLAECQKQRQQAEVTVESLQEKLAEYESEQAQIEQAQEEEMIEESKETVSEDIPASKATFRIDLYPRQGHYQGKIEHPLTRDKQVFSGLDKEVILEFISKHLPQPEEEEKLISQTLELSPTEKPVLQEITFQQLKRTVETGHPLQAHRPFTVFTQLHFPIMPTEANIDIDSFTYDVIVIATDADGGNVIARNGVSDILSSGVEDYESKITMSGLALGKYLFNIYTYAHFARIEDSKLLDVIVE